MARCAEALPVAYIEELGPLTYWNNMIHHVSRSAASSAFRVVL